MSPRLWKADSPLVSSLYRFLPPTTRHSAWRPLARLLTVGGSALLLLSSCIAIPVAPFCDEPLPKAELAQLKAGATQDEVVRLIGVPHATRLIGRFWYYGGTRPVLALIGGDGGRGGFLITTGLRSPSMTHCTSCTRNTTNQKAAVL